MSVSPLNFLGFGGMEMKEEAEDDFGLSSNCHSHNYYHEYCRLFYANVVLSSQMKELLARREQLKEKIEKLEEEDEDSANGRNKRHRRPANLINRHFKCEVTVCQKSYGSEGSLNQHMKLKHPELCEDSSERVEWTKIDLKMESS